MKNFIRFAFSFLYTRNWHTGRQELSHSRVIIFGCGIIFVLISLLFIGFLQAPIEAAIVPSK